MTFGYIFVLCFYINVKKISLKTVKYIYIKKILLQVLNFLKVILIKQNKFIPFDIRVHFIYNLRLFFVFKNKK